MNEVYVIAGGEWLRNNLNAIAAFMGTRTWDSIEKNCAHIVCSRGSSDVGTAAQRDGFAGLGGTCLCLSACWLMSAHRCRLLITVTRVKVHRVDNVPVGLAMPLSLTTRIGHAMVASYEMIFTQPDSVTYSKTGMLFGAELVSKSTDFFVPQSGNRQSFPGIMCRTA